MTFWKLCIGKGPGKNWPFNWHGEILLVAALEEAGSQEQGGTSPSNSPSMLPRPVTNRSNNGSWCINCFFPPYCQQLAVEEETMGESVPIAEATVGVLPSRWELGTLQLICRYLRGRLWHPTNLQEILKLDLAYLSSPTCVLSPQCCEQNVYLVRGGKKTCSIELVESGFSYDVRKKLQNYLHNLVKIFQIMSYILSINKRKQNQVYFHCRKFCPPGG